MFDPKNEAILLHKSLKIGFKYLLLHKNPPGFASCLIDVQNHQNEPDSMVPISPAAYCGLYELLELKVCLDCFIETEKRIFVFRVDILQSGKINNVMTSREQDLPKLLIMF